MRKQKDDFDHRWDAADRQFRAVEDDFRELYIYLFNGREREFDAHRKKWTDPTEIFDTTGAEAAMEFGGDLFTYMTPANQAWIDYIVGTAVPEEHQKEVLEIVKAREDHISGAVEASNYYEVGERIFGEAGIGTVAAEIDRPSLPAAIRFEPVPISELRLTAGSDGIEDRFRVQTLRSGSIKALLPDFEPSRQLKKKLENPTATLKVRRGWWPEREDVFNPQFRYSAKVEDEPAADEMVGNTAALCVGRFNPIPGTPWGRGPSWLGLPNIRTLDALRRMVLTKLEQVVDPAYTYVRDGLLDLSDGIEAGMAYPAMPGTGDEIRPIGGESDLDYGFFSEEGLRRIIRRGHYRKEEQPGKTPPSATQFDGEQHEAIKRMGRPGASVFDEFVISMLKRVEFLEVRDRGLEEQILLGTDAVKLKPVSPLERSLKREQVLEAQGMMEMASAHLGEHGQILVDGPGTFREMKAALGNDILKLRTQEEITQILQIQAGQNAAG